MKELLISCACCNGKGKQPISKPLIETLHVIKWSHPCTASEIYQRLQMPKLDRSAVNQRVKKLLRLGLVTTRKDSGSLRVYAPARMASTSRKRAN